LIDYIDFKCCICYEIEYLILWSMICYIGVYKTVLERW